MTDVLDNREGLLAWASSATVVIRSPVSGDAGARRGIGVLFHHLSGESEEYLVELGLPERHVVEGDAELLQRRERGGQSFRPALDDHGDATCRLVDLRIAGADLCE